MNSLLNILCLFLLACMQPHPIHKKWSLVAEELTYFDLDSIKQDSYKDRLDSIKNEFVEFSADGSFSARDGVGKYTLDNDSIRISLNGKNIGYKYEFRDASLVLEIHRQESKNMIRQRLYMK